MNEPPPTDRLPPTQLRPRRFRIERLLIPLVVTVIAVAILRQEVPQVRDATDRFFAPQEYAARQVCQKAALAAAVQPRFARLVAPGAVHATQAAWYVHNVVVGEMAASGAESLFHFSCYVDANGQLISAGRQPVAPARQPE